ncbi:polysaccharide deacetylase family protein [Rhizobium sp. YIM 134829]|uniref:polysaccharide deacetylase family protein n=1 Tax=Rhizobium sp. YIM 134829 TaxID=3390453 RepID=UPI003978A3C5
MSRLRLIETAKFSARTAILEAASLAASTGLSNKPRGRGVILTLHHVRPKISSPLDPNGHLEITPDFLELVITELAARGYDFLSIEAVPARLAGPETRPFAVFTLDDGYRDNVDHALPVFERHGVPFTVFACTGFIRRTHSLWWETALALLRSETSLTLDLGQGIETLPARSVAQKRAAYAVIGQRIMQGDERRAIAALNEAARARGLDPLASAHALVLDEAELKALSRHPLATIGAHSVSHRAMARLSPEELHQEIISSRDAVAAIIGRTPTAFAFPYGHHAQAGPRESEALAACGFTLGVTTVQALLQTGDGSRLTAAPRVNLDGRLQKRRYVAGLASGLAFRRR